MTTFQKVAVWLLRLTLGWLFFYAGVTKVVDAEWSAAGYLQGAKTLSGFYEWLLLPGILPTVNFLNAWGLTLIGTALLLGIFVRVSALAGVVLMLLYYFPVLEFPYIGAYSVLIDEHIIYAAALLVLASLRAGRIGGLEPWCLALPLCTRHPKLRGWLG